MIVSHWADIEASHPLVFHFPSFILFVLVLFLILVVQGPCLPVAFVDLDHVDDISVVDRLLLWGFLLQFQLQDVGDHSFVYV